MDIERATRVEGSSVGRSCRRSVPVVDAGLAWEAKRGETYTVQLVLQGDGV